MDLEYYQKYFAIVNTSAFCEKYGLTYNHVRKVLKGERPLTEKLDKQLSDAIAKFKEDF
ncbi:hypothetical protein [Chryseobacterium vrystaatense]|uniref:hypothetical protein n=1 Tax=Chryseobacterium vrystaatense TaxID=307480 RepID=UPI000A63680A|nr:hypothetical protein [Chryseobacterium vrystaatense]